MYGACMVHVWCILRILYGAMFLLCIGAGWVFISLWRSSWHSIILHQNQKSKFEISISWSVSILFSTFKDPTPFIYIIGCHRNKQNGRWIKFIGPKVVTNCRILHFFPIITLELLVSSFLEYRLVQNDINTIIISVLQAFYTYFYVVVGMIWSTGINTTQIVVVVSILMLQYTCCCCSSKSTIWRNSAPPLTLLISCSWREMIA